jgi:large subunit ribosomal protein L1
VPSLRAYPRLLLAFRRPAASTTATPQHAAILEDEEQDEVPVQFDDINDKSTITRMGSFGGATS